MIVPEEGSNGIKVSGWGATLEAHGQWVSSAILAIILAVGFIILHDGQVVLTLSEANYYLEIRNNQDDIINLLNHLRSEQDMQSWLISIPFNERPKLNSPEVQDRIERENKATNDLYQKRKRKR